MTPANRRHRPPKPRPRRTRSQRPKPPTRSQRPKRPRPLSLSRKNLSRKKSQSSSRPPPRSQSQRSPLTATWRGVTAETITIGVTYLDIDQLVELGFSPATWGDQEQVIQALVDDINNRGGINGRQVEVIMDKYNPIGATEAEAACLRVTEDNEVFAVLFGFLGPAEVANTCIVDTQETILVGGTITPDRLAAARAPWVNERVTRDVSTGALFTLLDAEGMLEGRSIAIVADSSAAPQLEEVAGLLREHGIEPVLEIATSSQVADLIAQNQEWSALAERIRTAGSDTLLLVGNASAGIENAALNGLEVDIWATDASGLGSNIGSNVNPESARGVITVGGHDRIPDIRDRSQVQGMPGRVQRQSSRYRDQAPRHPRRKASRSGLPPCPVTAGSSRSSNCWPPRPGPSLPTRPSQRPSPTSENSQLPASPTHRWGRTNCPATTPSNSWNKTPIGAHGESWCPSARCATPHPDLKGTVHVRL